MKRFLAAFITLALFSIQAHTQPMPPDGYHRWHPDQHYYRPGLHNDRYPPHLYYWHPNHGRYYVRTYSARYRHVRCNDGTVRRAQRGACRRHGGVLYYY